MRNSWRIGSVFGIPLFIDPSWLLILALFTFLNQQQFAQSFVPAIAWEAGLVVTLLLFSSVLLHELGHSLVARSQGIQVNSITLFLFGGIAAIEDESKTPGKAFQVAIAGPAVSLSIFALLTLLVYLLPDSTNLVAQIAKDVASVNLTLALFNLIPGLPLDGGQILKAAVWKATGNRLKGIHWAARTGKILGGLAIALGLTSLILPIPVAGGVWLGLIGWFVFRNANTYDQITSVQEVLLQLKADDAMTREFRVVDADATLRQFADQYLLETLRSPVYFAASDGRYRGLVGLDALQMVERSQWETQTVHTIVKPLTEIPTVEEKATLVEVINQMEMQNLPRITVLSPAGAVAGVIDRGDIVRALTQKLNLQISDVAIKLIKDEGSYPPSLKLPEIAKLAADEVARAS